MKNMFRSIILLLVCGVFGVTGEVKTETVSVMEGDSLTLHINTVIQKGDKILWRFGEADSQKHIVEMKENKVTYEEYVDGRFRDRLQISDTQTGSLTIKNMRLKHSGLYEAEINSNTGTTYKKFRVTVKEVITVSVMKGESVTLQTDVNIQPDAVIQWMFNDTIIANLTGPVHERFRNSEVKPQTGNLIITNIRGDQSGDYEMKIDSRGLISHRRFSVIVREVISVSVSVGDSVTLQTDVKIQSGDVIEWKFKGDIIANLTGPVHDARFRNSEVKPQTGNLIITHIRGDQFGDYELKINSRGLISHRRFSVSVEQEKSSGLSAGAVTGILVVGVVVFAAGVVVGAVVGYLYRRKNQRGNGVV